MPRQHHLHGLFLNIAKWFDTDLTLLAYKDFLLKIHSKFFKNIEQKIKNENLKQLLKV